MTADSVVIQRQEQDMGHIEEQLETAVLGRKTSGKTEKGYIDIVERQVKMRSFVFVFKAVRY